MGEDHAARSGFLASSHLGLPAFHTGSKPNPFLPSWVTLDLFLNGGRDDRLSWILSLLAVHVVCAQACSEF